MSNTEIIERLKKIQELLATIDKKIQDLQEVRKSLLFTMEAINKEIEIEDFYD